MVLLNINLLILNSNGGIVLAVRIITDSTSYIPAQLREEYGISLVSLSVSFETETWREEELNNATFYEKMAGSKRLPTSSQPTLEEIKKAFELPVAAGDAVVGIFISSQMSGTFSTAHTAKAMVLETYPDAVIELVDSLSNCMQLGFAVLAAARAAKAGKSVAEVVAEAQAIIQKSRFLFVPEVLDYLKKGGRIGGAAALLGFLLQIKPILTVIDGKTAVFDKIRTKTGAIERIISIFLEDVHAKGLGEVAVHHINDEAEGIKIADKLSGILGQPVPVYSIGPVIGLHVGPGTTGLVYYTK